MRRRSFLCLCFRIFFRRFLTTLAIHTPSLLPRAEAVNGTTVRVSLVESHVIKTVIKNAEVTQRPEKCQENARLRAFVVLSRSRYNGPMVRSHLSLFSLLLLLVVAAAGCQFFSSDKKVSADHARFERIVQAVEALRLAYEKHNFDAIRKLTLPLKGFQRFEGQIQRDFDTYPTISLNVTIERIYIQGDRIRVNVRWEGTWQRSLQETPVTDQGHGVWVWSGTQDILLASVEGAMPFGKAGR